MREVNTTHDDALNKLHDANACVRVCVQECNEISRSKNEYPIFIARYELCSRKQQAVHVFRFRISLQIVEFFQK
jgi:hypothetical protein